MSTTRCTHLHTEGTRPYSPQDPVAHESQAVSDPIDLKVLRAELAEKRKLLNILEAKGIQVPHGKELASEIDAALCDLDDIVRQTKDT